MAFPTRIGGMTGTSNDASNVITHNLNFAQAATADNYLFGVAAVDGGVTASNMTNGFSLIKTVDQGAVTLFLFSKVAGGGETTFTFDTSSSQRSSCVSMEIQNAGVVTISTGATGSGDNLPDPEMVTPSGGSGDHMVIAVHAMDRNRSTSAYPYADNNLSQTGGGANSASTGICSDELNGSSFNPGPFTKSADDEWCACTISIDFLSTPVTIELAQGDESWEGLNLLVQLAPHLDIGDESWQGLDLSTTLIMLLARGDESWQGLNVLVQLTPHLDIGDESWQGLNILVQLAPHLDIGDESWQGLDLSTTLIMLLARGDESWQGLDLSTVLTLPLDIGDESWQGLDLSVPSGITITLDIGDESWQGLDLSTTLIMLLAQGDESWQGLDLSTILVQTLAQGDESWAGLDLKTILIQTLAQGDESWQGLDLKTILVQALKQGDESWIGLDLTASTVVTLLLEIGDESWQGLTLTVVIPEQPSLMEPIIGSLMKPVMDENFLNG